MDGVIVDSEELHVAAEQQTCFDHGFAIDPKTWGGFKGQTATDIFAHLIDKYGDPKKHDATQLIDYKTDLFLKMAVEIEAIEGAIEFLEWSRRKFQHVVLVTSSNRRIQRFVVKQLGISNLFDHFINGDDVNNGKPHPEPYLKAMELSDAKPEESLVIEDSKSGIQSGKAAGCKVLAVTTSHSPEELKSAKPTFIALDYADARHQLERYLA